MPYSEGFKVNVNKLSQEEKIFIILTIEHPFLSTPVRLVNDSQDFEFLGENYLAMPFSIERQSDIKSELPQISLVIQNVGRSLIKWIDATGGGSKAKMKVGLARRSSNVLEEEITLGIQSVSINSETVSFSLVIQNNIILRANRWTYNKQRAPGLF